MFKTHIRINNKNQENVNDEDSNCCGDNENMAKTNEQKCELNISSIPLIE